MKQFLRYILTLVAILIATTPTWSANPQYYWETRFNNTMTYADGTPNISLLNNSTAYYDHVNFYISGVNSVHDNERLDYSQMSKNSTNSDSKFTWSVEQNDDNPYSIIVTKIQVQVRGYNTSNGDAWAWFNSNSKVECGTSSTGTNGSQTVTIENSNGLSSPVTFNRQSFKGGLFGIGTTFTLHNIRYTYTLKQRMPIFQYEAEAQTSNSEYGSAYSSWESFTDATSSTSTSTSYSANKYLPSEGMTKKVYFKAVAKPGYTFVGWKESANATTYLSYDEEYSFDFTSTSNDLDAPSTIKRYAVFMGKQQPQLSGPATGATKVGNIDDLIFTFINTSNAPVEDDSKDFYFTIQHKPDNTTKAGSANPNLVISYDPINKKVTGLNSGTATITFVQKETSTHYTDTLRCTVTVTKQVTNFSLNFANEYFVDDEINKSTFFTNATNSEVAIQVSDKTADNRALFTYNGSILKANGATLNADSETTTITVTQPETYKWTGKTLTKEVIVKKYPTDFSWLLKDTYYVDDVITDIFSKSNNNLSSFITSSNTNIVKVEGNKLVALNAGKVTITISQTIDRKWTAFTQTKEITILKHNIVAAINPNTAYWNELVTNPFAATSTHPVSGQVTTFQDNDFNVAQQGNEHIALMDANTRNIQTYYTNGTVDFHITRLEDRKYNALNQTLTLTVNASTESCDIFTDPTVRNFSTGITDLLGKAGYAYEIPEDVRAYADSVYITAKRNGENYFYLQYSTNGGAQWTDFPEGLLNLSSSYKTFGLKIPEGKIVTHIRPYAKTGATLRKDYKDFRVTRAKFLTPSDSPVILPVTSIGTPETKTFTLNWSTCADEILLTNSNPHFTINTHNISSAAGQGSTAITVTCDASVVGSPLRDTIVIYDNTQRIFVPVECEVNNKFIANIKGTTAYSKKVDDTWVADFKFDTCQTTLPSDDINAPFYYTIEHDLTGNDVLKPGYKNQVITYVPTYNPDTKEVVNTITAHNAGTAVLTFIQRPTESHYTDTLRCVITVTKYTTSFDLKGRTTYYTGDEDPYNALFNVFTNNDEVPMTFTSGDESIINYENDALRALCAGTTSFTVAQAESYKWLGHTQTIPSITVSKYNSNFSLTNNGADITCLIGDKIDALSLYTTANNEILPTIKSDNPEVVSFNHTTRQLEANTAGEAVITISQPTDCKWTEYTATRKIIVQKHTPVFTFQKPVYFNDTIVDYFTTSNTQTALTIASQTDTDVAIAYFDQNNPNDLHTTNLISFNKEDTTFVTFTQEENWYWYARTVIDTIVPINPNNHVTFTIDQQNKVNIFYVSHSSGNSMSWSNGAIQIGNGLDGFDYAKELVISFTGIPKDLTFTYGVANSGTTGEVWDVYESTDGTNWSASIWHQEGESGTCNKQPLNPDTRFLKFRYGGNFGCYFKNIHVTELNQFEAVPNVLDFGLQYVDNPKTTKSFDFKFANAGYKVHLQSTDTMFTVATTYIDTIGGEKYGTVHDIQVTYNPLHVHQTTGEDAMILIWDEAGHRDTVFLHVNTVKSKPSLYWTEDWSAREPIVLLGQHMPDTVAKATNGYPVKYRSDDESILKIAPDSLSFIAVGIGETYITAHADSDRVYLQPDTIRKRFRVTDKLMQYIVWEDNLTHFCIGDQPDTLHAQAWVMTDAATGEWEYSPEQTAKIQYYSSNPDVVEVQGNLLIIKGEGELLLSATINGDTTYEKTSAQVPVRVRDCSVTCSDADLVIPVINANGTVMMPEDKLEYDPYALFQNEHILRIDTTQGIPGQLIFTYRGIKAWGQLEGKIRVWESTDGGENWQQVLSDADAVEPENGVTHYSPLIPLSRNATHIKFERFPALDVKLGYHILQYITVLPDKYIESIPDDIHWGNVYVGNSPDTTIAITYSSIRSNLQIASSQPSHLTIDKSTIVDDCGAWDTVPLTISLKADISIVGNYHQYVTVTDPIGGMTDTIHVYANIVKNSPTITWNTTDTIRSSAEWETKKTAISSSGDQVLYEITEGNLPEEYAYLNDAGKMILLRGGTVTARAYTLETTSSNAVSLSRDFFIIVDPLFEDFSNDGNWLNDNNWNIGRTPWATDSATIKANKHVLLTTEIVTEGLRFEAGSSIHITPTSGLSVGARGIQGAATDGSSIIIDNLKTGIGFLRISPAYKGAMPRATVNYQTRSTLDTGANRDATWQYFGAPGKDVQFTVDGITWLYQWSEPQNWINKTGTLTLEPFAGYAITQYGKPTYALSAEAITSDQTITLTKTESGMNGNNLFANSYMAPIDAKNFTPEDFSDYNTGREDIVKTFYIFNSGSWNEWNKYDTESSKGSNGNDVPGQYCAVPAFSSKYMDSAEITTLPPMQGIYVIANTNGAHIHLNYEKHVWNAGTNPKVSTDMHEPMRTPQRLQAEEQMQQDNFRRIRIQLNSANSGADRLYIIQTDETTPLYDNGYDAPNQTVSGLTNIYTTESFGKMEVSCSNRIDSMYIGFQAGSDMQYTLSFSSLIGDMLYLEDLEQDTIVAMQSDEPYTFQAAPQSVNDYRFRLLIHPKGNSDSPNTPTDTEQADNIRVWINNDMLHIIGATANTNIHIYNISGTYILSDIVSDSPYTCNVAHLQSGVYLIRLNEQIYKVIKK